MRSSTIIKWSMFFGGMALIVLGFRGRLGSGLAALLIPGYMINVDASGKEIVPPKKVAPKK